MAALPFSNFAFRKAFFILWMVWLVLHVYTLYSLGLGFETALQDSTYSLSITGLCCWLLSNNLAYYQPKENRYTYIIIWCLILAFLATAVSSFLLHEVIKANKTYYTFLNDAIPIRFGFSFLLLGWMAMICVLWYNQQEKEELDKRRTEADKLNKEAELSSLREKLQPHFLFNSLNSISALTFSKPEKAREMIHQLADFLRGTIKKSDELSTLKTELNHLKLYLEIEKVRFGHRLNTIIDCDDDTNNNLVPPMILQPLVENAIKFGLYDTLEDVSIGIKCWQQDNLLNIQVSNPFDPTSSNPKQGVGFGLDSVQRRLLLIYNRKDLLKTAASANQFITTITIPQL